MPTATFTANFSSFYDAVAKAEKSVADFGAGAERVGDKLERLNSSFSGKNIIQQATLMAKAVEDVGGTSALTEKELARLGSTVGEAVAKMKALGLDVPANLRKIADETANANQKTTDWTATLGKVAAAVGIAFSVDTVKNFIGSVFTAASEVKDLSDQWGVSTTAVQKFTGAAKASGVEAAAVGKSIQFLSGQLSENSDEYRELLKNVGLSGKALRELPMEEAYRQVIASIGGVKDETLQLELAIALLGPSAKQMIGAIRDNFLETAAGMEVMTDATIRQLEAAQASWESFWQFLVRGTGTALGTVMSLTTRITSSWDGLGKVFGAAFGRMLAAGGSIGEVLIDVDAGLTRVEDSAKGTAEAWHVQTTSANELIPKARSYAEILKELKDRQEASTRASKAADDVMKQIAKSTEDYRKAIQAEQKALDDLAVTFSGRDLIGKAIQYLQAIDRSIPIEKMSTEQKAAINKVMLAAIETYERLGEVAPEAMMAVFIATRPAATEVDQLRIALMRANAELKALVGAVGTVPAGLPGQVPLPEPPKEKGRGIFDGPGKDFQKSISDMAQAFSVLAQVSDGAFGDIVQDIGTVIAAMDVASKSADQMRGGLANFKSGNVTAGMAGMVAGGAGIVASFQQATKETGKLQSTLNGAAIGFSVAGPWGAAVGAGIGLIKGFFNEAKKRRELASLRDGFIDASGGITALTIAARDAGTNLDALLAAGNKDAVNAAIANLQETFKADALRDDFVDASGGVEALTRSAESAGITVDALFAAKSAEAVNASIKEISDALKFQEDAYQLAIDTAQKYGFTIEELGPAMSRQELDKQAQGLYKDWEVLNSAGLDTVLITDKMSKSVNEYVGHAIKMGTEVPEAMRPMLEQMAKSGKLLDENGDAVTDLEGSGIKFSLSMSEGFQKLIDKVADLTDAISRSLGLAIKNVPDVKVKGKVEWEVPPVPQHPTEAGADGPPQYAKGTGGFVNFGAGTPVILHGWEAVVPRGDAASMATVAPMAAAGGGSAVVVNINAQGAFFDTPDSLQRLASRVSEALTAKYSVMGRLRAAG